MNRIDRTVIYVYCSNPLYSHSMPIALNKIVALTIIYNVRSSCNLGTNTSAPPSVIYASTHIHILIKNNSCTVLVNFSLSSLTLAHARIPYVGTPNCAIISKYVIKDVAKEIFPIPSGFKILDTYGNVINGNKNADIESITFIIKLYVTDRLSAFFTISSSFYP